MKKLRNHIYQVTYVVDEYLVPVVKRVKVSAISKADAVAKARAKATGVRLRKFSAEEASKFIF